MYKPIGQEPIMGRNNRRNRAFLPAPLHVTLSEGSLNYAVTLLPELGDGQNKTV